MIAALMVENGILLREISVGFEQEYDEEFE